jgi:molybdate transport system substrate-binding protein
MRRRQLSALLASGVLGGAVPGSLMAQGSQPAAGGKAQGATVFAAASLTDAMKALGEQWRARGRPLPRFSFAASSALARQMEQGAPADIFASADEPWMDYVQQRRLIVDDSRVSPLANSLVLIAPADRATPTMMLTRDTRLVSLLGADGRIASGDPGNVPVGRYAQAALSWMGQWELLSPRLARADNVRSALLLVERGEAPLGIVYSTDAAASKGVKVIATFPAESHPAVTYPFAITRHGEGNTEARDFFAFATGAGAEATYRRLGFGLRAP